MECPNDTSVLLYVNHVDSPSTRTRVVGCWDLNLGLRWWIVRSGRLGVKRVNPLLISENKSYFTLLRISHTVDRISFVSNLQSITILTITNSKSILKVIKIFSIKHMTRSTKPFEPGIKYTNPFFVTHKKTRTKTLMSILYFDSEKVIFLWTKEYLSFKRECYHDVEVHLSTDVGCFDNFTSTIKFSSWR